MARELDTGAFDAARVEGWAATDDPIAVLLGEHRTILQVLDEIDRETTRLENGGPLREAFFADVVQFADEFDTGLHHQKEEQLLFPALERAGLDPRLGPTAVLRDEHLRIRFCRDRLAQALAARDRTRLGAAASHYTAHGRAHVLKENQLVFPLCRRLLSPDELATLHREFRLLSADQRLNFWLRHPHPAAAGA